MGDLQLFLGSNLHFLALLTVTGENSETEMGKKELVPFHHGSTSPRAGQYCDNELSNVLQQETL